jgi:hypothetical protein
VGGRHVKYQNMIKTDMLIVGDPKSLEFLREPDPLATTHKDGQIYRNIRLLKKKGETEKAKNWLVRLNDSKSGSKLKDISQLEKAAMRSSSMKNFSDALDNLLEFRGLWDEFQIGCFHRLLTIRCPEV